MGRLPPGMKGGAVFGRQTGGIVNILDADRDAMQRPERAAALADSAVVLAAGRVAARLDGDALSLESLSQAVRNAPETAT